MNFICLSPNFPPNYYQFGVSLKKLGINVLGIGDAQYDNLHSLLKESLTEYYRVDDLHNFDQLEKAINHFTSRYGKIEGIDSHNEYWLETEALLRSKYNIEGLKIEDIERVRKKSEMKKIFRKAGMNVAKGILCNNYKDAKKFAKNVGFPIIAKPNAGVGASNTYKIYDEPDLKKFYANKLEEDYILEEFIYGEIYSFDGLVDKSGDLVFSIVLKNEKGVMEVVHEDSHVYYYTLRDIPQDLDVAGKKILTAFDVKGRFFHFEFFREFITGRLVALEVNMRPPGGFSTDMFNYSMDVNVYDEWASVICNKRTKTEFLRKYHVCFVSRKWKFNYLHSHDYLTETYSQMIASHDRVEDALSRAMGNYCYLVRSSDLNRIFEIQQDIHKLTIEG